MRKSILLGLVLATLCTPAAFAGPFHDCDSQPTALPYADDIHNDHGNSSCSNNYDVLGSTYVEGEACTAGCLGSTCPAGQWWTDMDCARDNFNSTYTCDVTGQIRCGGGTTRTYSIHRSTGLPGDEVDATAVSVTVGSTVCDCSTSATAWAANCN